MFNAHYLHFDTELCIIIVKPRKKQYNTGNIMINYSQHLLRINYDLHTNIIHIATQDTCLSERC